MVQDSQRRVTVILHLRIREGRHITLKREVDLINLIDVCFITKGLEWFLYQKMVVVIVLGC